MPGENKLLEAGKIVNTHGLQGEIKIQPWADSPEFLTNFRRFYIGGGPINVLSAKVHKGCVIAALEGINDIDGAILLKNKIVCVERAAAPLEEGRYFVADLVGLRALDAATGEALGTVSEVLSLPANNVYVVKGERQRLIPAVPEFVEEIDIAGGFIRFRLIEGL